VINFQDKLCASIAGVQVEACRSVQENACPWDGNVGDVTGISKPHFLIAEIPVAPTIC
jgi:hypothetical protein